MTDHLDLATAVLESLDVPILVVDRELAVVSCNQSFRRWVERLGGEACPVGRPLADAAPFLSPLAAQDFRTVFATGSAVVSEERSGDAAGVVEIRRLPVWRAGEVVAVAAAFRDVTVERRLLDALRLKDAAIEASPGGIVLCDLQGSVTYANRSFAAMWGYADGSALEGTAFGALWHARAVAESALAGLVTGGTWSGELMARRADGSRFAAHLSAGLVRRHDETPACSVAVVTDVSERLGMEEALAESETNLRTLLDINADAILLVSPDGHVLVANSPAAYAFERPLDQVLGLRVAELLTRDEAELVAAHNEVAARTGSAVRFETSAGGRVFDYRICPIGDGRGGVATLALFRRDVTERANADAALRETNRSMQALIEAAPFAIVGLARDGAVRLWNRTAERWFGWDEAEAVGRRLPAVPHEAEPGFREILERVGRGETVTTVEVVYRRRDGRPIELMLSAAPVLGAHGGVAEVVLVAADVTERNRMHARLVDAQKMDAVGRLASGAAHDFNNLLQAILSLVEVLRVRPTTPERVTGVARTLEERARQGAALTRQLGVLGRRSERRIESVDVGAVLAGEAEVVRTMLPATIAVELERPEEEFSVLGDPDQLRQVVMNLATNAAAAMPEGGRMLLRAGRTPAGRVLLEVRDTGCGIPAEVRGRIFDPFFTTRDPGRASGLGLTVVRDIVRRHGGAVAFETSEGAGTTFRVELPGAATGERAAEGAPGAVAPAALVPGRGERVLLVEDEEAARDGLREMLGMLGYEVTALESGESAGLLPPEPAFDLLLADLVLPGAAGTDLARGLAERWPAMRVLLMSGYSEEEARRLYPALAGARLLQKPFDLATLAHEVREVLDERTR